MRSQALLLALALVAPAPTRAQSLLGGLVIDQELQQPVPCIDVMLVGVDSSVIARTRTGANGGFRFVVQDSGVYRLRFGAWGFYQVESNVIHLAPGAYEESVFRVALAPAVDSSRRRAYLPRGADEPPQPRRRSSAPRYPDALRRARTEGDVFARFVVDSSGAVDSLSIRILRESRPGFAATVVQYLTTERFFPGRRERRPVCELMGRMFSFRVE